MQGTDYLADNPADIGIDAEKLQDLLTRARKDQSSDSQ